MIVYERDFHESYKFFRGGYPSSIAELKGKLGEKWDENSYVKMSVPSLVREEISLILDELQKRGEDISPYLQDLEPHDREADEFVQNNLETYLDHIEDNIRTQIRGFHPEEVSLESEEFEYSIGLRGHIEGLIKELEKYRRDTTQYRKQVAIIDEEFKRQIPIAIKNKTFYPNDSPWSPKEYWWDHLEEQYGFPDEIID